jgi:hypothetical protein
MFKVVQKIKIHILCSITFPENRAVYEKKKVTKYCDRRRMSFAYRITKARIQTHTLRMCKTYCFPTAKTVTRGSLNFALYKHGLPCLSFSWERVVCTFIYHWRYSSSNLTVNHWPLCSTIVLSILNSTYIWRYFQHNYPIYNYECISLLRCLSHRLLIFHENLWQHHSAVACQLQSTDVTVIVILRKESLIHLLLRKRYK